MQVYVCGNRRPAGHRRGSCAAKGSVEIRAYFAARVAALGLDVGVTASPCLDRCAQGPCAVIYAEDVWYRLDSFAAVDEVIRAHLQGGRPVAALFLPE